MSRLVISVLLLALGPVGTGYVYKNILNEHFLTVTPGQVYQSAQLPPELLKEKVERYGIRAVIDLRSPRPEVDAERALLADRGVAYFNIPSRQVPKLETVEKVLRILDRPEYRPVLIHCKNGIGRSSIMAAVYRMEFEGWSNERARRVARWQSAFGDFGAGDKKGAFILTYVPRWRRPHPASGPCESLADFANKTANAQNIPVFRIKEGRR